jgi:putative membrane protein
MVEKWKDGYVRRRIKIIHVLNDSWPFLVLIAAWSIAIVFFHEIWGFTWLVMPVLPITLIGIAVSLYLGFKSVSAYNRWWEARKAWGSIATNSRVWTMQVQSLVYNDSRGIPADVAKELIYQHLAWISAAAFQLRRTSRLKTSEHTRIFGHRRIGQDILTMHQGPDSDSRFLQPNEYDAARTFKNPAAYLLRRQAESLRELATAGYLDSVRLCQMMELLARLDLAQGISERIKHTPFPRPIAHFGVVFTWIFVLLLPLAFLDVFETEAGHHNFSTILSHRFMFTLVPFAMLISWVFHMMERVSDSSEDSFEGGVNDIPVSTMCRSIEIDLKQALGEENIPAMHEPVDEVLY